MLDINAKINEVSRTIESIKKFTSPEERIKFYMYADFYILEYFQEALEYLIMKRDTNQIAVTNKKELKESHDNGKRHDSVYREIHQNFVDTENELIEELLKYAPSELVDNIKKHYNNRLNFIESYALEKATDRLARRFDCVINFADYLNEEDK